MRISVIHVPHQKQRLFFCMDIQKYKNLPGRRPWEAVPQESGCPERLIATSHTGVPPTHFPDSGENKEVSRHTWLQTYVEHIAMQTHLVRRFCQEARSTEHVKKMLSSHAFASRWTCSRFANNTSARCASVSNLFRSGRGRRWWQQPRFFCTSCRVLKTRTRSMLAPLCQELVDSVKPALFPEDRPIAVSWQTPQLRKLR